MNKKELEIFACEAKSIMAENDLSGFSDEILQVFELS